MEAFIKATKDGVTISNALVFHSNEVSVYYEPGCVSGSVRDLVIYTTSPRWWEIRKWWRLMRLIRQFTSAS